MSLASDVAGTLRSALSRTATARETLNAVRAQADQVVLEIQDATDGTGDDKPGEALIRLEQAKARLDEAVIEFQAGDAAIEAYIADGIGDPGDGGHGSMSPQSGEAAIASQCLSANPAPVNSQWFPAGTEKIPAAWGNPRANKKGEGYRWTNGPAHGVRIDKGHPLAASPSQRVDHVIIRDKGVVIGRDGTAIRGSIKDDPVNAHIPLSEWRRWRHWNCPT